MACTDSMQHTECWPEPCVYGISGREITKYTVIYDVYVRIWPAINIRGTDQCSNLYNNTVCTTTLPQLLTLGATLSDVASHTHTHKHTHTHTHTHAHARTHAHMHTHMHTHMHAHIHARAHTHTNTHTHTHTCTHTHTLSHIYTQTNTQDDLGDLAGFSVKKCHLAKFSSGGGMLAAVGRR